MKVQTCFDEPMIFKITLNNEDLQDRCHHASFQSRKFLFLVGVYLILVLTIFYIAQNNPFANTTMVLYDTRREFYGNFYHT